MHAARAVMALLALSQPAAALSCLAPSVEGSFAAADAAPGLYVMAIGRLTLAPDQALPDRPHADPVTLRARLTGRLASATGFDHPADMPVDVMLTCAGPWCAGMPQGDHLMFLERRGSGLHRLVLGPCPQGALPAADDTEARAMACLADGCALPD